MKVCSKCKQNKPLNEFRNDKHAKFGRTSRCKECLAKFKPKDITCLFCFKWFTVRQGNYKFCNPKCHTRYWNRIMNLDIERYFYMRDYRKHYNRYGTNKKTGRQESLPA